MVSDSRKKLLFKNDNLVRNLNFNINILGIIEIMLNPDWLERICNIQINWSSHYTLAEFLNYDNGDLYINLLTDEVNCFINVQHYNEAQLIKEDFKLFNLPEKLLDFVLNEPIVSVGTTNLMWSNGVELNSLNDNLNTYEKNFTRILFNEPSLKEINLLIQPKYGCEITKDQFDNLMTFAKTKVVSKVFLQSAFNVDISDNQMNEISEIGFTIS